MIGKVHTRRSFSNALDYCLKDKLTPGREKQSQQKVEYSQRAEIIRFNQCYGDRKELVRQFQEVTQINQNIRKPCFHVILGLPPQDRLSKSQWADVAAGCAKTMGFDTHQYVVILHRDKLHQHVHLLANRVGFEGKIVEDKHQIPRINAYCLQTEQAYHLTLTKGMIRYQSVEQRQQERQNQRAQQLKRTIANVLETACNYSAFEAEMQREGYRVYKNEKGIAFYHEHIAHRGSDAGYPWKKIETQLAYNEKQRLALKQEQLEEIRQVHRHRHRLSL